MPDITQVLQKIAELVSGRSRIQTPIAHNPHVIVSPVNTQRGQHPPGSRDRYMTEGAAEPFSRAGSLETIGEGQMNGRRKRHVFRTEV